jgi:glycosyltransferase involved in cell wall biosynthesis
MKLIIQIPCYNEAQTLPATLAVLPKTLPGLEQIEILVIDDGSTDDTSAVARAQGVEHILRLNGNQGLARAYMAGLSEAIRLGADIILNTDADNQYDARYIPDLLQPILQGQADMVIGCRPIQAIKHFSVFKRFLQSLGSRVVSLLSRTPVKDAPSGFRALTRDAALRLNVFNSFTYTLETLIQAGQSNLRIVNIPVAVNPPTRPSRLVKNIFQYVNRSIMVMLNAFIIYKPVNIFSLLALAFLLPGTVLGIRYLVFMFVGEGRGHVQSVIVAAVFIICGIFMLAIGIMAHLLSINRRLLEELRYISRAQYKKD